MSVVYSCYTKISNIAASVKLDINLLASEIFGIEKDVFEYLGLFQNPLIIAAYDEEQIVGFKLGFQYNSKLYYSWLGGVLPAYRGQGIASRLMDMQHEHIRAQGYSLIETRTENRYKDMLVLNLRHGFEITGTLLDDGDFKIILRKNLLAQ